MSDDLNNPSVQETLNDNSNKNLLIKGHDHRSGASNYPDLNADLLYKEEVVAKTTEVTFDVNCNSDESNSSSNIPQTSNDESVTKIKDSNTNGEVPTSSVRRRSTLDRETLARLSESVSQYNNLAKDISSKRYCNQNQIERNSSNRLSRELSSALTVPEKSEFKFF